ncbi:eCIS core domain-containing protein, partial [Halomicrobium katesii]
ADFSDVRIHTGAKAAEAADAIDAKAFTCGNSIVFNSGEYDPESTEGQFLLAHELAHVKQQNGGAPLSMMPQQEADLEIDPDPQLERNADQAAEEALQGDEPLTVSRMGTDVQVQRMPAEQVPQALELFKAEVEGGVGGSFQQSQNQNRIDFIEDELKGAIDNIGTHQDALAHQEEAILDARAAGDQERASALEDAKESIGDRIAELYEHLQEGAQQIALTDEQREKLDDFDGDEFLTELGWTAAKGLVSLIPGMGALIATFEIGETALRQFWEQTDGSLTERLHQVKEQVLAEFSHGGDDEYDYRGE